MRIRSGIISIAAALLLLFFHTPLHAQQDMGAKVIEAVGLMDREEYQQAQDMLRGVVSTEASNDAAWYYLGLTYVAQRDVDMAEDCFQKASSLDPGNFWYRYKLASLYALTSREDKTVELYESLLEDFPDKTDLYFNLVELYAAQGQYEKALETIEEIETVFGVTESLAISKFNLLQHLQRPQQAFQSLEEYNSKYSSPYVLSTLADHHLSMYQDSVALKYYDEALELDPDFAPALMGKAETYRMTRRYEDYFPALNAYISSSEPPAAKTGYISAVLERTDAYFMKRFGEEMDGAVSLAVSTHPSDSSVLNMAGRYYFSTDRSDLAKEYFARNENLNPQSRSALSTYIEFLMYQKDWQAVSSKSREAFRRFPQEITYLEIAALGDYHQEDYESMLEVCGTILEKASGDTALVVRTWSTVGDVYHVLGEPKKSYKAYENALKVDPDDAGVLNNYAYYLSLEGRKLKKALAMSRRTLETDPDNSTYLDTYGWILYLLGRSEEAKPHFKRAMLYGGNESAVIMDHYAEVLFDLGEYDRAMVYWNKALLINDGEIEDLEERINMRKQEMEKRK